MADGVAVEVVDEGADLPRVAAVQPVEELRRAPEELAVLGVDLGPAPSPGPLRGAREARGQRRSFETNEPRAAARGKRGPLSAP